VDCDDLDPDVLPAFVESWYDGVDADCAGGDEFDLDGDGFLAAGYDGFAGPGEGVADCADQAPAVFPGRPTRRTTASTPTATAATTGRRRRRVGGRGQDAHAGGSAPLVATATTRRRREPRRPRRPADPADVDCDGSPGDYDVDGDGVPVLTDCSVATCDCDDTDAAVWVGDSDVPAGTALQPLVDAACDGVVLQLEAGGYAGRVVLARPLTLAGVPAPRCRPRASGCWR
jgi:hypothetical protein